MKMVLISFVDGHFQCFSADEIKFFPSTIHLLLDGECVCSLDLLNIDDIKIIKGVSK